MAGEAALRRVWQEPSVGGGFAFDRYYDIVDKSLDLSASRPVVTSHYGYQTAYAFPTGAYSASGPVLAVSWDSRDSTINAYRGVYALLSYQWNAKWAGSTRESSLLNGEFRAYLPLSRDVSRNVLAFWVLASGVIGDMPYLTLPSVGWDGRNRSGRGYLQGRYRGTGMAYGEVEWRFRLTNNGVSRTNITLDFAWGAGLFGVYFGAGEAF